mmetsp:Transcript_37089/g.81239  ORF Transcript_37089/g.81239 Transcript_37089/m.81239 type:complete len:206 (+) Transcript_37089:1395-2012(+)
MLLVLPLPALLLLITKNFNMHLDQYPRCLRLVKGLLLCRPCREFPAASRLLLLQPSLRLLISSSRSTLAPALALSVRTTLTPTRSDTTQPSHPLSRKEYPRSAWALRSIGRLTMPPMPWLRLRPWLPSRPPFNISFNAASIIPGTSRTSLPLVLSSVPSRIFGGRDWRSFLLGVTEKENRYVQFLSISRHLVSRHNSVLFAPFYF